MPAIFEALHADCQRLGTRLFTISVLDATNNLARRAYTSHSIEYPTAGTKAITRDGWYDHVITGRCSFVANTTPEFAKYFFDHALITSMGLGSCMNIPVIGPRDVVGTVNLLAGECHFTPDLKAAYESLVRLNHDALVAAMIHV